MESEQVASRDLINNGYHLDLSEPSFGPDACCGMKYVKTGNYGNSHVDYVELSKTTLENYKKAERRARYHKRRAYEFYFSFRADIENMFENEKDDHTKQVLNKLLYKLGLRNNCMKLVPELDAYVDDFIMDADLVKDLVSKQCPKCGTTDLYEFNKSHSDTQIKFDATCKKCGYKFKTIYQYCGTEER